MGAGEEGAVVISARAVSIMLACLLLAGFGDWMKSEDFSAKPYVPTKGDVPTIGYGSTRYENGQSVKLTDPPITRQRGEQLARNLIAKDEQQFRDSLPGVKLFQEEYDLYLGFMGQFGITNWRGSSMRRDLLAGNYRQACDDLLKWHNQGGRDCSQPKNWGPKGCKGVWSRQQEQHAQCIAAQE